MKKLTTLALLTFTFALLNSGQIVDQAAAAGPPVLQDKQNDRDELEQMILKKIEERKKELAEERAKKGLPPVDEKKNSSSSSRKSTNPKPAVSNSTLNKAKAVKQLGNANIKVATPAKSDGPAVVRGRDVSPKVIEYTEPTEMSDSTKPINPDVKIQFSFDKEEWGDIIQFFADEIGYGLFMGQTGPPQGVYSCSEPEMGLLEALDYLNGRLGILNPPHVLVRNGTQLVLVNESGPYPQPLIAIVRPEQLRQYGKYEVVRCVFDLDNLDGNVLSAQIRELVSDTHQDGFSFIQAANRLEIRERVLVLREFNNLIQDALRREVEVTTLTYECQHIEPENLLFNLRQMMGIGEGQFQNQDGSLRFSVQPLGNKIFLTGSPKRINEFERFASIIDVKFEGEDPLSNEKPYLKTHSVSGDLEVVFQVVQTLLDGEPNVKLDKDEVSGNLYLWASKRVHDEITAALMEMAGGVSFAVIPVKNKRPTEIVTTLEELLNIDTFAENPTGPKLVADSDTDTVMVHGSPQEIVLVRKMIEEIDSISDTTIGPRRPVRFIEASPRKREEVMELLQIPGIMDTMGRKNRLNLIMPKDRGINRNRNRLHRQENADPRNNEQQGSGSRDNSTTTTGITPSNVQTFQVNSLRSSNSYFTALPIQQEDETDPSVDLSQIGQATDPNAGYQAVQEQPTVPGAPVEVRFTDRGIVISTDDLDAGDDIETMILDLLDETSDEAGIEFFVVQYRKVSEVKAILEHIFGLASSGGGAAGGLGGLLGGAVKNTVGGAAGDLVGGLLGGGDTGLGLGSDSAGAFELEGEDVKFGTDGRLNYLIVTGATENDIEFIGEIIDMLDQDSPPIVPLDIGQTYVIEIKHRDPMYVKEKVQEMLSPRFRTANANNQAGGQPQRNAEAQIRQAVLNSIGGRNNNRRGGNAAAGGADAEQPKATLGVDEELGALLVTGPKFIYQEVRDLVTKLDIEKETVVTVAELEVDVMTIAETLKAMFPDNITIDMGEDSENGGGAAPAASGGRGNSNRSSGRSSSRGTTNNRSSGATRGTSNTGNRQAIERGIIDAIRSNSRGARGPGRG